MTDDPNFVCEIRKRLRANRIGHEQYPVHIVNVPSAMDLGSREVKGLNPHRKGANVFGKLAFESHSNLHDAAIAD